LVRQRLVGWSLALVLGLLLVVAVPAGAVLVEDLSGEMTVRGLTALDTSRSSTEALDAFLVTGERAEDVEGSLSIRAAQGTVNWTHVSRQEAVASRGDPEDGLVGFETSNESDEESFTAPKLESSLPRGAPEILVVPQDETAFEVSTRGPTQAGASGGDSWQVGELSASTGAGNESIRLFEQHAPSPGAPVLETTAALEATLAGNTTVYVWGVNVTVTADGEERSYRSGHWSENETRDPATGQRLASEDHYQLLRLRLTDAHLVYTQTSGDVRWTAERVHARTQGAAEYEVRSGELVTDDHRFPLGWQTVTLDGDVRHELSAAPGDEGVLDSRVQAERADVSGVPAAAEDDGLPWPWLGLLVLGAVVGVVGHRKLSRGEARGSRDAPADAGTEPGGTSHARLRVQAEEALQEHRPRAAREAARELIEADVDALGAWSIVAASHLQEGRPERVLEEVAGAFEPGDLPRDGDPWTRASLAYLVAYAYVRVGEVEAAWPWVEQAAAVEWVREKLASAPVFAPLRETERFAKLMEAQRENGEDDGTGEHRGGGPDPAYR
jgi:hypothetical protein